MLMVSELLAVARGDVEGAQVGRSRHERYANGKAAPPIVVWNVCRHCNMTCPHCYAAASRAPSRHDLGTDEARRVLDALAAHGVRALIFSGGEPLLRDDLLTLMGEARGRGIVPHLSTNGSLIDQAMASRLAAAGVAYVGVSVDGLASFNDAYRGLAGGYDKAMLALAQCRALGIKTGIRMTLTRRNRGDLAPLLAGTRGLADRFYVSHLVYAGRARSMRGDDLSPEETRETLFDLFAQADGLARDRQRTSVVCGGNDSAGPLLVLWVRERYGADAAVRVRDKLAARGGNSAGVKMFAIDHRGRVHPDQFWSEATLGDLSRQSLDEVLAHPLVGELRERKQRLRGRCASCASIDLCGGSHRERALAASGDVWGEDPACVLRTEELRAS